jgi:magnesium-transporting ATPase (P-type)
MSVIVETPEGKVLVMCKGADSIIMPLLSKDAENVDLTLKFLEDYAKEGLRTLLLAEKEIEMKVFKKWHNDYKKASAVITDREKAMDKIAE